MTPSYVSNHFRIVYSRRSLRMKTARVLDRCRIIKLPIFLVASNAAVGGPSTATTFAESLEWTELVVPAAVCGTLGYALGTPVAFAAQLGQVPRETLGSF